MEYSKREIEQLLERWENGLTTLAEERELKQLLADEEVCSMLEDEDELPSEKQSASAEERAIFDYFMVAAEESTNARIEIPAESSIRPRLSKRVFRIVQIASVAAVMALIMVVTLNYSSLTEQDDFLCRINGIAINDIDIASEQAETALAMLNAGFELSDTEHIEALQREEVEQFLNLFLAY